MTEVAAAPEHIQEAKPATLEIVPKHPLAIRWFHWLNFPILFTMIWSGILIYWADSAPGQPAGQFYHLGPIPLFPEWLYSPKVGGSTLYVWDHRLAEGMSWHFLFMWPFAVNGLLYVLYLLFSKEWRLLWPGRKALSEAWQVVLHDLRIRKQPLPPGKYNAAQRLAYTAVIALGAASLLTGLAIYKPWQLSWLTAILGGYEAARFEHFWLMMAFVFFFLVHILQVVRAGGNNFRGMLTGKELVAHE